ncbi:MAG: hypothetical protein BJ554DRAFT_2660 [Olpidium bornovanus]|uniref:Uncharacterized protein n=1 Tax=Olpidium bornovanus TaxID=278681 RepID=A0A8H8A0Y4_9FUNG|nr:MAG: hypothetical protein BJ554DRAFT_2660 [Olpidium bornovanus]
MDWPVVVVGWTNRRRSLAETEVQSAGTAGILPSRQECTDHEQARASISSLYIPQSLPQCKQLGDCAPRPLPTTPLPAFP